MGSPAVIFEERLRVPVEAHDLECFRRWAFSPDFPESGRIDFLGGDVEVDMSPEDLHTHGRVKSAISHFLEEVIGYEDRGEVFIDSSRVSSPAGGLSVEPDVVVVLWESLEAGRVRYVPAAGGKEGRFREIEGAPDLVVEIVSDASVGKDTRRLPARYAAAGVPELWLVDARGDEISFAVHALEGGSYRRVAADAEGRVASRVVGRRLRLSRERTRLGTWRYHLETRD
jgi:Uma2 family endonuclease